MKNKSETPGNAESVAQPTSEAPLAATHGSERPAGEFTCPYCRRSGIAYIFGGREDLGLLQCKYCEGVSFDPDKPFPNEKLIHPAGREGGA